MTDLAPKAEERAKAFSSAVVDREDDRRRDNLRVEWVVEHDGYAITATGGQRVDLPSSLSAAINRLVERCSPHRRRSDYLWEDRADQVVYATTVPVMTDAGVAAVLEVLRPFAEGATHLHPSHPDDGVTLDGIEARAWRRAYALFTRLGGKLQ